MRELRSAPARSSRPIDRSTIAQAWFLFDARERRIALLALGILVVGALSNAFMVVSVLPFLYVLSRPELINENGVLRWLQDVSGLSNQYDFVVALGIGTICAIFLANLVQMVKIQVLTRFTMMRHHSLAVRLLSAYLRHPYEFFLNRHTGEMTKGVLSETAQVVSEFLRPMGDLLAALLTTLAIVIALLWVNPAMTIAGFLSIGLIYGVIYWMAQRHLRILGRQRATSDSARYRLAAEVLGGVKDIKIHGCETGYLDRFSRPSQIFANTLASASVISQIPRFLIQTVLFGGIVVLCLMMINRDSFTSGETLGSLLPLLGAFALGGQKLIPEVQAIFVSLAKLSYGAAAVESLYNDLHDSDGLPRIPPQNPISLGLHKELRFEEVGYTYPGASKPSLTDISIAIKRGMRIGVVGSTGAGKSTFADLILGLLRPTEGLISVDGILISDSNLRAWQGSVGYVPQQIFLTDSSVAENIAFGMLPEQIDEERMEASARLAQIHDFVQEDLSRGYQASIGERGGRISGGQRQRIGIARALYRNADLIVFDEATSALDNLTEREVMTAIDALPGDKTVIMIAHRLSTVRNCDMILVLDRGCIAGFAPWDDLIESSVAFRRLVDVAQT